MCANSFPANLNSGVEFLKHCTLVTGALVRTELDKKKVLPLSIAIAEVKGRPTSACHLESYCLRNLWTRHASQPGFFGKGWGEKKNKKTSGDFSQVSVSRWNAIT